jgi:hypothetical protein
MLGLGLGLNKLRSSGLSSILLGAMVWGRKSLYKWGETSLDVWGLSIKIVEAVIAYVARVTAAGGVTEGQACLQNKLQDLDTKLLLDNASLVLIPSGYEENILFSQVPTSGLGDLSVVRATTATRVNSAGLIEVVPRNLLNQSNNFSNVIYGSFNQLSLTANAGISPDGTNNSFLFTKNTSSTLGWKLQSNTSIVSGLTYTLSAFVKKGTVGNTAILRIAGSSFPAAIVFEFNFDTETITNGGSFTKLANGWYRISAQRTATGSGNGDFQLGVSSLLATDLNNAFIYGFQLEVASTETEYLPTVTRLNFPRLDYTNSSCPSLLVEPQRTNTLTYSNEFSNIAWLKNIGAILANNATSPEGITNASKLVGVALTTQQWIYRLNAPVVNGSQHTFSIFAKKGEYNFIQLRNLNNINANTVFNLNTGAVHSTSTGTAKIENYGNGWYRCSVTATASSTGNSEIYVNLSTNGTSQQSFLGDGTSGVFIYGAQHEAGSYATSYIPTVAAAVTRNADTISKTGISSLIGQTEGTLFFDGIVNNIQNASSNILNSNKNNTTISTFALFKIKATNKFRLDYFLGNGTGTSIQLLSTNSFADGTRTKIAIRYKSGDFAMYINGNLEITSTSTFTNNGVKSELFLNDSTTFFSFQESVSFNQVALYTNTLSNAELASLTTL